ncbi:sulfotransferase [Candidatus Pelagibacter sp.]|nr:sulfotransferase [Candidatus Pelagibacter sp.]
MLSDIQIQKKINALSNKLNLGNFQEVITEASVLLKKNKHQVFFNILCLAYQGIGELNKSETVMNEALKLNPNNPYFLNNMGTTQHKMGNFKVAEDYFLKGLKIVPNYINILNNLGNLKRDLDNTDEAINYYKKSLSINPDVVPTLLNISICYQSLGNYVEAKNHLNNLLKLSPNLTIADRLLSSMKNYKKGDKHLLEMSKKIDKLKLSEVQLSNLFFALGKANEDLKEYNLSFNYFKKGNDILKKNSTFSIDDEKKKFLEIKSFDYQLNQNFKLYEKRKLIFIVGMPRSGTSLVEQILSSHKNVYGGGELTFLKNIIDNKFLKRKTNNISNTLLQESHNDYIDKISLINDSKKIFTDKTPLNFKYIGFIKKIFKNSKIIICKRNKYDLCWSNYKNFFAENLPFNNNLIDLGNYYRLYEDLIKFWEDIFPGELFSMNYSQLINNPEFEIRKMLKFCTLDWDPNCMSHENNTKTIKTASVTQARKPINKLGLNTSTPYRSFLGELEGSINN